MRYFQYVFLTEIYLKRKKERKKVRERKKERKNERKKEREKERKKERKKERRKERKKENESNILLEEMKISEIIKNKKSCCEWCCECEKCAFIFLLFSAWLSPKGKEIH